MVALPLLDQLTDLAPAEQMDYIRAHRAAFVGHLLIGVLTTGIYCLPSCPARQPKTENIRFFRTEAEAQAAGLRACRRCRPDYFYRNYDPDFERITALVDDVRCEPGAFAGLEAMVAASGIGATKLHALFQQHYQVTPAAFLSRARFAAACTLLTDSDRQVIDVAYTVGYESLSAFHVNFRKAAGLSPKTYQRLDKERCFTLSLPENYLSWVPLKLLGRDPESVTERVNGNCAMKALTIGSTAVLLHLEWNAQHVRCQVESVEPLAPGSMQAIHAALIQMLGLTAQPDRFERFVTSQPDLARLVEGRRGLRIPLSADLFEGITWAIVGQQVNLGFAYKLRRQLAQLCGQPVGHDLVAHPTAQAVAALDYADLTVRQFSRRKAEYLIDTARLIVSGQLKLDRWMAADQLEKQLMDVRGLGRWSVHYIMMRAFGFADCVPLGDTGLSTALQRFYNLDHRPDAAEVDQLMAVFKPYRSLATYHLWASLGATPA